MESKTREYQERINTEKESAKKAMETQSSNAKAPANKKTKKVRSAVPVYFVSLFVVLWAWLLPLYKFSNFFLLFMFSGIIYLVASLIWRPYKVVLEPEKEIAAKEQKTISTTGDPDIDKMQEDAKEAVRRMDISARGIKDNGIRLKIAHLQDVTERIVDKLKEEHEKKMEVRRFFNYYLPTTIKLIAKYNEIDELNAVGENIDATKADLEEMIGKLTEAFDKQLDALYGKDALDVSTEIKVMESLLRREGLL